MLKDSDFLRMEFNPLCKKAVCVEYPKLREIVRLQADKDVEKVKLQTDKMVRYVLLMYDINSPMRTYYPDLEQRKSSSADIAGYDRASDDMDSVFDFKIKLEDSTFLPNERILNIIMDYLRYQNNWVWSMIIANEQAFYEYNMRVMMPVDGTRDKDILQAVEIKTRIMTSQDEIYQRLQRYYRDISGGDTVLEESVKIRKRIRPEDIANVQPNR